eukprot:c2015_g1_i1 orf=279-1616(-)
MEHYMEHTLPLSWPDMNKGPWVLGEGSTRLPSMMECASVSENATSPTGSYIQNPKQQDNVCMPYSLEDTLMVSPMPPQIIQETYSAMRGVSSWIPGLQEPLLPKEFPHPTAGPNSSLSHILPPFARGSGRDRSNSTQANPSQASPTWCQSYINGPRARAAHEAMSTDTGSSGEGAQDEMDGRNALHNVHFSGSMGDAQVGPSQMMQTDAQQVHQMQGGQPVFVPLFGTHTGVAQPQGAAAVVAGTARPRVRARRGQATDPHSIAERLRRERIAERMKALQELVPNANKTDKASMLDEIIDYVKFLQLQVKVLSMSRLGGAGAVAPLITDFPAEGQNNLAAALGSAGPFQDGMVVAERQVARLMEEDMGSAMQFLQAKGLCLMPVSLATVISTNNSRMMVGSGGGQQGFSTVDQSRIHAASSTTSTLASVASSGCIGGEGDSKSKQ